MAHSSAPPPTDAFAARMQAQFGNPEGPTHGGRRPGAGRPSTESRIQAARKVGIVLKSEDYSSLSVMYPNITTYLDAELEGRRIREIAGYLLANPAKRNRGRGVVLRFQKLFEIGYDRTLHLYQEAVQGLEAAHDPVGTRRRLTEVAHHTLTLALELQAREGGGFDGIREVRECLKLVAGMSGMGAKAVAAIAGAEAGRGGPAPGQTKVEYLGGMLARLEGAIAQVRADLEVERDALALTVGGDADGGDAGSGGGAPT